MLNEKKKKEISFEVFISVNFWFLAVNERKRENGNSSY